MAGRSEARPGGKPTQDSQCFAGARSDLAQRPLGSAQPPSHPKQPLGQCTPQQEPRHRMTTDDAHTHTHTPLPYPHQTPTHQGERFFPQTEALPAAIPAPLPGPVAECTGGPRRGGQRTVAERRPGRARLGSPQTPLPPDDRSVGPPYLPPPAAAHLTAERSPGLGGGRCACAGTAPAR